MPMVEIFTDGACDPNPGRGAWAAILRHEATEREISGFEPDTTNNRMEMMAAIQALAMLNRPCSVVLHSDSQILINGMSRPSSLERRAKRVNLGKLPNADLWADLDRLSAGHVIEWVWVRGHNGHPENERCDRLAAKTLKTRGSPHFRTTANTT